MSTYHQYKTVEQSPKAAQSSTSSEDSESARIHKPVRVQQSLLRNWWQEIGAILLSAISFLAIIVTLSPHDKQPLPQWPYSISVNALVSVFVVVFKASVLFVTAEALGQLKWLWYNRSHPLSHIDIYDQATRGPLGSFKLLWKVRSCNLLPPLGAIIIILMVVVDPITQQLLVFDNCYPPVPNLQATIPLTKVMDGLGNGSARTGSFSVAVPPPWQQAINSGMFAPGQTIAFNCRTGNCTFPEQYRTLAYCSKCEDISEQLTMLNTTLGAFASPDAPDYDTLLNESAYVNSLPSGLSMISSPALGLNCTAMGVNTETISTDKIEFILGRTPDNWFQKVYLDDWNATCAEEGQESWRCRGYGAASCTLYPCIKTFTAAVDAGHLEETLVDSAPGEWGASEYAEIYGKATIDVECLSEQDRLDLEAANYHIPLAQKWMGFNISWAFWEDRKNTTLPQSMASRGCVYVYDDVGDTSLRNYYAELFQGYLWAHVGAESDPWMMNGPLAQQQIFNWGNDLSFQRVTDTFTNISIAMTNHLRQSGNANMSEPAVGEVLRAQTCLQVRWPWLSFLAALAVISWSFFAGTLLLQFRNQKIPAWKSSLFPVMAAGSTVNLYSNATEEHIASVDEMKCKARTVRSQLKERDGILTMVET